jgi:hypothetical protein
VSEHPGGAGDDRAAATVLHTGSLLVVIRSAALYRRSFRGTQSRSPLGVDAHLSRRSVRGRPCDPPLLSGSDQVVLAVTSSTTRVFDVRRDYADGILFDRRRRGRASGID